MDRINLNRIISNCLNNERSAQNELFHLFAPFIMATIRRYLKDEFVIKDVFLRTFEKAFKNLHTFDKNKGEFKSWLKTISINESLNAIKSRSYKKSIEINDTHFVNNEDDLDLKMDIEYVVEIINKLKEPYDVIFNLVMDGYNHKEISNQLNISEATSRSYFKRSRKMIIDQLQTQKIDLSYE